MWHFAAREARFVEVPAADCDVADLVVEDSFEDSRRIRPLKRER